MGSRLDWGVDQLVSLNNEYIKIVDVVYDYASRNGYMLDKNIAQTSFRILLGATLLREESKWSNSSGLLAVAMKNFNMLDIINSTLNLNRTFDSYVNNNARLSSDLDNLYDELTKSAMYMFFYVLVIYSKIKNQTDTPFGQIDEILCALNYGARGEDNAKTYTKNYIFDVYSTVKYFPLNQYTINNYLNWLRSGFICDLTFHNGK